MEIHVLESPSFDKFLLNRNVELSRFFLSGRRYQLKDTKRNALDITDF